MVNFKAIIDTTNVSKNAKIQLKIENSCKITLDLSSLISSKTKPPTIIGMLSKKLNSDDFFSSFPHKIKLEIVDPERDKPGTTAIP